MKDGKGYTMKKISILFLISLFLISCSLPFTINWNTPTSQPKEDLPSTEAPPVEDATLPPATEAPPTPEPINGTEMNLGGVYMVLPPCLAAGASGTLVAAAPYDEMGGPMEFYPENRKITYQGYPLSGKFFDAKLVVYPVAEFVAMNQSVADRVGAMQNALASQQIPETVPLLPIFNAAQVFKAQAELISFQNGQGIRYLTEYAQYYAPATNQDLFYSFQGITSDGKYWVSAIFPVNAAYLQESFDNPAVPPGGIPAPSFDDPNLDASMTAYYGNMINLFNNTPDGDFIPGLDCLDQYISTLQIGD